MQLQEALEQRYSCRSFAPDVPTPEQIEAILQAGRIAPTARNLQPERIWVISKPEDLAKIDEATPCRYGAPVVLIVGFDTEVSGIHTAGFDPDWPYGSVDSISSLMYMMLKATDLGLQTCWLGRYDDAKVREAFNIPANIQLRALLDIGTPSAEKGGPSPTHTNRLPLENIVTYL